VTKCWLVSGTPTPRPAAHRRPLGCLGDYKLLTLLQFAATTQLGRAHIGSKREPKLAAWLDGCGHGQNVATSLPSPQSAAAILELPTWAPLEAAVQPDLLKGILSRFQYIFLMCVKTLST